MLGNRTDVSNPFPEVEAYLRELHVVRQLSTYTLKAYRTDLSLLQENAREEGLSLDKVSNALIRRWAAALHATGKSPRTIARTLSGWRGFYAWLALEGKEHQSNASLSVNPVADVKVPRRNKLLPKALSVEQAISLVEFAAKEVKEKKDWESYRDYATIELLYSSGLRLSELLGIDVEPSPNAAGWLDWDAAEVSVLGKGNKRRAIPVGKPAMTALRDWREIRAQYLVNTKEAALFISIQGTRLSARTVQARLRTLAIRAGLPTHVHPHMMRHSFASHVLQSSHDLRAVQEMLGHASIASTQIYTSLDFQHLAKAYDSAHPRAKAKGSAK